MKMLLLEDDEPLVRGLTRLVKSIGVEVVVAHNVDEGRRALDADTTIDLLLADYVLANGENGFELMRYARERHPTVRRVLTTGLLAEPLSEQGLVESVLFKPFGKEDLRQLLRPA